MRNRTSDLRFPRSDALPLIHKDSTMSEVYYDLFLYFFTEHKTHHLSYSISKHDAIDTADPSCMQDAYHMNFVIDLANCRVSEVDIFFAYFSCLFSRSFSKLCLSFRWRKFFILWLRILRSFGVFISAKFCGSFNKFNTYFLRSLDSALFFRKMDFSRTLFLLFSCFMMRNDSSSFGKYRLYTSSPSFSAKSIV